MRQIHGVSLAACLVGLASGCSSSDAVATGATVPVTLLVYGLPQSDTVRQAGLEFSFDRSKLSVLKSITVTVDTQTFTMDSAWVAEAPVQAPVVIPATLPNGRRAFSLRVVDENGKVGTASWNYVVHVPDVQYSAQFLAPASYSDSKVTGINAAGEVTGYLYSGSTTPSTAFLWRTGTLDSLPKLSGSSYAIALGLNNVGDVVGYAVTQGTPGLSGVLWRSGAATVVTMDGNPVLQASFVDDQRRAIVIGIPTSHSSLVNLNTGVGVPHPYVLPYANAKAQAIGDNTSGLYSSDLVAFGGVSLRLPPGRPGRHDPYFRGVKYYARGIDDAGDVLGLRYSDAFLSHGDTVEYLEQRLPGTMILAPTGEVIGLSSGTIFIWSASAGTRRVVLSDPTVTVTSIRSMNSRGQIIGTGTSGSTGLHGAALLSPVSLTAP